MNGTSSPVPGPSAPTRVRYGVLAFAGVLSMITYLDRACIGQVGGYMQQDFALTDKQWGFLLGAFGLAYAAFEIPSGWLGDVFGPRRTLLRIVLWWSLFTVLLGSVYPMPAAPLIAFGILLVVNFLFGMGEAGAYPNIARAFHSWFPSGERGFAQGAVWMAGRFAGGLAPLVVLLLLTGTPRDQGGDGVHWRHVFWIFGSLGLFWCAVFYLWFRDRPDQHPGVNPAELAYIRGEPPATPAVTHVPRANPSTATGVKQASPVTAEARAPAWLPPEEEVDTQPASAPLALSHSNIPWARILGSGNLWALCGMYFFSTYGWYFFFYYLPKFLDEECHISTKTHPVWVVSLLRGAPLLLGSTACLLGGLLTDFFIRRTGDRKWGRRLFGMIGHGMCAVCFFVALLLHRYHHNPWLLVLVFALAAWFNDLTMGASWASCVDLGRQYSGIVSGFMNSIGNLGQAAVSVCTGLILGYCKNRYEGTLGEEIGWQANLFTYGVAYLVAVALWSVFDATKPVVGDEGRRTA